MSATVPFPVIWRRSTRWRRRRRPPSNGQHATGFDLNGAAGGSFFSYSAPPLGVSGAAAGLRVDPAIVADNSLIAAAGVALPGDNAAARAIAALRNQRVLNGNTATLSDGWGNIVYSVGSDAQGRRQRARYARDDYQGNRRAAGSGLRRLAR
jgi:hypothetical protein